MPLPEIDAPAVQAFWRRAIAAGVVPEGTPPPPADHFGDSAELADELASLVVEGRKRASAGMVADFEHDGVSLPEVGGLWIVLDGAGRPCALARTTELRIGPLSSVDDEFAWDEGEGDRTRAWWLEAHERSFRRRLPKLGLDFSADLATVFERFEVLYCE